MSDRRPFTTTLSIRLLKKVKKLAIDLEQPTNALIEDALNGLLKSDRLKENEETDDLAPINFERRPFTTSLNVDLLKNVKKLAIDLDRPVNVLIEESLRRLIQRHDNEHYK